MIDEFSHHGGFLDRVKREVTDDSCEEASEEALIGDGGDSNNDGNDLVIMMSLFAVPVTMRLT